MNLESKVMESVANIVSFIKSQSKTDLIEARNQGLFSIDDMNLIKLCNFLDSSIDSSFVRSSSEVVNTVKTFEKHLDTKK